MLKTLYGKLATILFGLFFVVGLLYILLGLFTTRLYVQEGAQRLNHDLAAYLVSHKFFIEDGRINQDALKESFDMLMGINQNIELYLLDPKGKILAYSAPPGKVVRESISLVPLKRFLSQEGSLPILGEDPRHLQGNKVFSVSPVPLEGPTQGYLYIILGSEQYDTVAHLLRGSYLLRLSTGVALASLFFVLVAGLFLFHLVTRRLRRLSIAMETFKQSDFHEPVPLNGKFSGRQGDEIDRLGTIYTEMSHRMIHQLNKIRHADALRRELVSNVSHDLRTPLASLQGYLETLLLKGEKLSPQEQQRYLETALSHSERLGKLVSELFELAKLESRERQVDAEPFHLGELVQDIVQKFQLTVKDKKIRLQTRFPEDLPYVFADIGLIERAIQNLVDNAIRYTEEGGTITLSLLPEETSVSVQVTDNGYGISQEDIPYIFDRFYRVKERDKEHSEGAGLGLAITRRILELHGSKIEVLSELDVGTTFTFQLPIRESQS